MVHARSRLTLVLLFTALSLLTYFGTTLASGPISFLYRNAPGLGMVRNLTQIVAWLATAGLLVAAAIIAVQAALQPVGWLRKLLYVVPLCLLIFLVIGVMSGLLGIGAVGALMISPIVGPLTFANAWLIVAAPLTVLAVILAAATVRMRPGAHRAAMTAAGIAAVLGLLVWLGLIMTLVIVLTSQPSTGFAGGPGGAPGGQGALPSRPGAVAGAPGGQSAPATPGRPGQGNRQPEGPGGPSGPISAASAVRTLVIGSVLMTIFQALALWSVIRGWRALRSEAPDATGQVSQSAPPKYGREAGRAVIACLAVGVIVLVAAQLVPVSHTNPPIQTPIKWDSSQTEVLAHEACMDCHSNETAWPWYAKVAPGSWLTVAHVNSGRQQLNLSDMNAMPAFRKSRLAENMAEEIRRGNMPTKDYLLMHPAARLSDAQKEQLIQGLQKSLGQ
jgi:hypothetical protein